jgi:nucleoside-diphosphate-sugar epimerase
MKSKNVIKKSAMVPTALVAGGAGFVGSHLCEALLAKGARVIVLDNFTTGKQSYVNHLLTNPNFALYDTDINNGVPEEIQSVDYIFHLAGLEEYSYSKEVLNLSSLLTNAFGTKHLLDLAKASDAKFLLLSTTDVYEGRISQLELTEYFGRNKIGENRYMLAEAKRYAEALVWEYYKKHESDVRIVRVPEIYGPRMNLVASGNLGRLLSELISGRDLTVYGEGVEKEFYLYIDDVVSGVLKAMYTDKTKGSIFSLVPNEPVSVLEMAYMVKGVADSGVRVKFHDGQSDGYFKPGVLKMPDTFNLEDIRWEPKVSLKEGITQTLESFNYSTNTYSFKPAKLIEQKIAAQVPDSNLFSLMDAKKIVSTPPVQPLTMASKKGANFVTKPKVIMLPKFPRLSLPKINFPALPLPKMPKLPAMSSKVSSKVQIALALLVPAIAIFVIVPSIGVYVNAKSGIENLKQASESGKQLNTEDVKVKSKAAYESFYRAKKSLTGLRPLFMLVKKESNYRSYDKLLGSLTFLSKTVYSGAKAAKPMENLWEVVRPDTSVEMNAAEFEEARNQMNIAKTNLLLAQADFKYVYPQDIPSKYRHYYQEYKDILGVAEKSIEMSLPLYSSLPNILGADKPKKYLILFQNSNEIRATGGFIGSYGLLTLDKGKIKDLVIDDVYNPDGQIDQRNIVAPIPAPIVEFLKETKLHIRNANWDPDYTVSANTIEDLYFKVTGERMDGVVAVDLYFIQSLLKATGPIFLTAYNEEVSYQNVYERAELHSEFNYQNGSDQKRSFLTVLGSKLLERLFSLGREQIPSLADAFMTSLNERHMQIYFTNDPINQLLKANKWDGSLVTTQGDYLFVVDSNLGGTKANYYVKKKMDYQVGALTRDGLLRATLKLEYNHTGKDLAWPGGPYTDYLRVITQSGAKLTGATIKFDDKTEVDILKNVVTNSQGKYVSFESSFILQPQSKAVVTLSYDLNPELSLTKGRNNYELYWQKQAGTQNDEYTFGMVKPFGFVVSESSPEFTQSPDRLEARGTLTTDKSLYVKLQ